MASKKIQTKLSFSTKSGDSDPKNKQPTMTSFFKPVGQEKKRKAEDAVAEDKEEAPAPSVATPPTLQETPAAPPTAAPTAAPKQTPVEKTEQKENEEEEEDEILSPSRKKRRTAKRAVLDSDEEEGESAPPKPKEVVAKEKPKSPEKPAADPKEKETKSKKTSPVKAPEKSSAAAAEKAPAAARTPSPEHEGETTTESGRRSPAVPEEEEVAEKLTKAASKSVVTALKSSKFDPIRDACWKAGEKTPYLHLARVFEEIDKISSRLKIIELLTNAYRSIIALSPQDLLPAIYLTINKVAPAHEGLELGVGDALLIKAIAEACGRTPQAIKASYDETGDLGTIAQSSRTTQKTMFPPPPLTIDSVFKTFRAIASESGKDAMNKRKDKIKLLLVSSRQSESQFLIRSLQGKLRIGLAEQSVLVAIAHAVSLTPPSTTLPPPVLDASAKMSTESLEKTLAENTETIKSVFSEMPSYDIMIPALLNHGIANLSDHIFLTPGVPIKPMLAKPTKGLSEVLDRFSNMTFTCEFKYDGERAQVHVLENGEVHVFSRNMEDHTGKYPDIIERMPRALGPNVKSCILDCEVVAFDPTKNTILPFQVLSTRGRKNIQLDEIKVKVTLFAFDLLYLNGEAMLREPFSRRRDLLYKNFNEVDAEFQFARHINTADVEEIQTFLNEAIAGNCEGLMVKTLDTEATYEPAKRSNKWLKIKKDYLQGLTDSLDLVPIGAYYGKGKRTGVYGAYLLACYDDQSETYQTCCKLGTGFSDEVLTSFTNAFKEHRITAPRPYYQFSDAHAPDVWFDPWQVWEVLAADLSISPHHTASIGEVDPSKGIALRFPRFIRTREDKSPEDATTASQVAEMYRKQATVKSNHDDGGDDDL